eukprot:m.53574 g.53574  ORF g.53574 m.53574 type:complete len:78 (-) comp15451_c0_seq2:807-1040(-)
MNPTAPTNALATWSKEDLSNLRARDGTQPTRSKSCWGSSAASACLPSSMSLVADVGCDAYPDYCKTSADECSFAIVL